MSSDGVRRPSFVERLKEQAENAFEADNSGDNQYLDALDLWVLLGTAADIIEAQKKELDAYAYVAPVTLSEGGDEIKSSQRIISDNRVVFVDYGGESVAVEARDARQDVYFTLSKYGEGPVMFSFKEFKQFCQDGLELIDKVKGSDDE